jgi:hypothetical protein
MLATKKKTKKGISMMIGYVLLVTFALIMGVIAYQWMKTYIPRDALECPDGISVLIKNSELNCTPGEFTLNFTLLNNGRFNIAGYFIYATNNTNQSLATIDISSEIQTGGQVHGNAIIYDTLNKNILNPNEAMESTFIVDEQIYTIEILPVRFQTEENRERLVSCGNAKIKETLTCS